MNNLIVWLTNGETMLFHNVADVEANEHVGVRFTYDGVSTHERRKAQFYSSNIAGFSVTAEETK